MPTSPSDGQTVIIYWKKLSNMDTVKKDYAMLSQ